MAMPSQVAQVPNVQQHLQPHPSQVNHQHTQQLQPINATQALQIQQQKIQINSNHGAVGPATAAVATQNRSQHIPMNTQHQPQYQHQQRQLNGGIPMAQQQQQAPTQQQQLSTQYQQQPQRINPSHVRVPQQQTQPVVMPNSSNHPQHQQQIQPQQIRQINSNQRNGPYAQQRIQSQQNHAPDQRSIPTATSQNSLSASPVPPNPRDSHTPLYERIVTEEVKELKEYVRMIEQQSRRISDLEKIHLDLEKRLEVETTQRSRLEYTLQYRERYWKSTTAKLEEEKSKMENSVKEEKIKVERLLDMVNRLQNEIQSMIKNKFNSSRPDGLVSSNSSGGGVKRVASAQAGNRSRSGSGASVSRGDGQHQSASAGNNRNTTKRHIGPHELLAYNGSAEAVRERNAFTSLLDFFGM